MGGPVIGITCYWYHKEGWHIPPGYFRAVEAAGALPVLLPPVRDAAAVLAVIDGLILAGGGDIEPARYGAEPRPGAIRDALAERDEFELELAGRALDQRLPVLGICRGQQLLAVAGGGTLHQDLADLPGARRHNAGFWPPSHGVVVAPNSRLARVYGQLALRVNSYHHQAVDRVPPGWVVSARAPDGVIEALEPADPAGFALAVQWHPEEMFEKDPIQRRLFEALASAAAGRLP